MEYLNAIISVLLAALVIVVGLYIRTLRKVKNYWKDRGVPYEYSLNIISNVTKLYSKPLHELLFDQYRRLGRVYGSFEFRKPILTVCEPELLRDILVKDFHIFHFRRDMDFGGDPIFLKMVSVMKGEDWKRVRTVLTPAFTSKKMRHMSHIINQCSKTVIETLSKHEKNGRPFDCKGIFGAFTLDVIASAAFATKIDSHNDPENIFVKNAKAAFIEPPILRFISFFILPAWLQKLIGFNMLPINFFKNVVLQVLKERRGTGKRYDDILQLLIDALDENETGSSDVQVDETDQYGSVTSNNGDMPRLKYKKLYEDEVISQCILFFLVGYETTASTLSFMAYALALNQECQEKLIKEVDEVYKKHEEVDYDIIRDMKYLDCVVSETLRMYPSLIRTERTASEDYKLGNTGITIEKGTIVGVNIHAMHYDPEFFPNPETFDPERFMSENGNHHQYAYLPFGAGPRNCLGMRFALMEIKLCMSNILRNYRFKPAETTKVPLEYKKAQGFLSVNELPLLVERREKSHL